MMNFREIAAASKGRLILRYFTEDRPEPIHPAPLEQPGRQLEEGASKDFSIPSSRFGQRGITPAFGYGAPHPSAGGTLTLLIHALLSAHYGGV